MNTPYIEPNFILSDTYEKLSELDNDYSFLVRSTDTPPILLGDLLKHTLLFVVAEPGHGKSRLIDELQRMTPGSVRVDFKTHVTDEPAETWLHKNGASDTTETILLDGLDEAPAQHIQSTIYSLVDYVKQHPNTSFYISCRIHYLAKYQQIITGIPRAEYLLIKPLQTHAAKGFLRKLGVTDSTIATLFTSLQRNDASSVLQNPRYLEMIAKELSAKRLSPDQLNRSSLFEAFTNGALQVEDLKISRQFAEYKKRMLELLALTMEVAQVNEISSDDFVTFMDRAESDAKRIAAQIDIEHIYEHSLLTKDPDTGHISFTNREIQEYLAAKYVMRMANPIRKVFALAIDAEMREILPSWRNTLSYIIDEIPEVARGIIDLNATRVDLDLGTELLVTGSTSRTMSSEDKLFIFSYIWDMKKANAAFIDRKLSFHLAHYIDDTHITTTVVELECLIYEEKPVDLTQSLNLVILCGNLIKLDRLTGDQKQTAINKLLAIALHGIDSTMQINAVYALAETKDASLLKKLRPLFKATHSSLFGALESFAYDVDKTSTDAIDLYVAAMKKEDVYYGRMGLEELNTSKSLHYFLQQLAKDRDLIKPIIDHDRLMSSDRNLLLTNLEALWEQKWLPYLKHFISTAFEIEYGHYAERSSFVEQVVKLIAKKDPGYYRELLIDALADTKHHKLVRIDSMLAKIMQPSDVAFTVEAINQLGDQGFLVFRLFTYLEFVNNPERMAITAAAKKQLPDMFKQAQKQQLNQRRQQNYNSATARFERAFALIEDTMSKPFWEASDQLCRYLEDTSSHKEPLDYTESQVEKIWSIHKAKILDIYDPADISLTATRKSPGNTSYTITQTAEFFERAFVFGYLTGRNDMDMYRAKLIAYFPYMHARAKEELFTKLNLTNEEKRAIVTFYKDTSNDAIRYQTYDFIALIEKLHIVEAIEVLRKLATLDILEHYVREYALRVAETLQPSKPFLLNLRQSLAYTHTNARNELLETIDSLLITNHADADAIQRRFVLLKAIAFNVPGHQSGVMYAVSDDESELHDKTLAKPLMALSSASYLDTFLDLLDFSFQINQKGTGWSRYSDYLWEVVTAYFVNLCTLKDAEFIESIDDILHRYPAPVTTNFLRYFDRIKSELLTAKSGLKPYVEAIQTVNTLNTIDELKITSGYELYRETLDLLSELERWANQEGLKVLKGEETTVQRTLSMVLENLLVKKFGKTSVRIERETQAIDGTRTDFYVYYGFLGPVLVELKLSSHGDLAGDLPSKESYKSMQKYMKQFRAQHGILLLCRTVDTTERKFANIADRVRNAYGMIPGVSVATIDPNYPRPPRRQV